MHVTACLRSVWRHILNLSDDEVLTDDAPPLRRMECDSVLAMHAVRLMTTQHGLQVPRGVNLELMSIAALTTQLAHCHAGSPSRPSLPAHHQRCLLSGYGRCRAKAHGAASGDERDVGPRPPRPRLPHPRRPLRSSSATADLPSSTSEQSVG